MCSRGAEGALEGLDGVAAGPITVDGRTRQRAFVPQVRAGRAEIAEGRTRPSPRKRRPGLFCEPTEFPLPKSGLPDFGRLFNYRVGQARLRARDWSDWATPFQP